MAELGQLERAKRRRLQESYADLRPDATRNVDRQAKLRNLLLGAAADAGISSALSAPGGSPQAATRAVAAAAAASIAAISANPGGKATTAAALAAGSRRAAFRSPIGFTASAASTASASATTPVHRAASQGHFPIPSFSPSSLTQDPRHGSMFHAPDQRQSSAHIPGGSSFHQRRCPNGAAAAARPPPPGPMEGGFLPEGDPIQRLSRLPVLPMTTPPAVHGGSWGSGSGVGSSGMAAITAAATAARTTASPMGAAASPGMYGSNVAHGPSVTVAAAATTGHDDGEDDGYGDVEVPSDVELALISLKSDLLSHPACADLPPLALRSQLACMLTDRSTVERQLDEQRRANRVRVFKLPTGADEFGILTTSDYRSIVRQAADAAAAAAASAAAAATNGGGAEQSGTTQRRTHSAPGPLQNSGGGTNIASAPSAPPLSYGAYGPAVSTSPSTVPSGGGGGSAVHHLGRWHAAAELFLSRVVDRFTDFQLSHDHLVDLLMAPVASATTTAAAMTSATTTAAVAVTAATKLQTSGQILQPEAVEEQISLLLKLGCIARHTDGDADAFVLAVPGAGRLVKAVLGGRRELQTWLSKRQYQEAPEAQICKLRLRSSCLPPLFHVRDLLGRGAVRRLESTSGPVIKLPGKRQGGGG